MTDLQAKIEGIYGKAKVHMSNGDDLMLEPGKTLRVLDNENNTFSPLRAVESFIRKKMGYAAFVIN